MTNNYSGVARKCSRDAGVRAGEQADNDTLMSLRGRDWWGIHMQPIRGSWCSEISCNVK